MNKTGVGQILNGVVWHVGAGVFFVGYAIFTEMHNVSLQVSEHRSDMRADMFDIFFLLLGCSQICIAVHRFVKALIFISEQRGPQG